jgi:hypothetical protein
MGLDMYLYAKKFYWHNEPQPVIAGKPDTFKVTYVTVEAVYWRKSNHIHHWFVENIQGGQDDCGHYFVSREDLRRLVDTCKVILADHDKAEELLPTQGGFFFGSTSYDEWYFGDLEATVTDIERALNELPEDQWEFEYTASW